MEVKQFPEDGKYCSRGLESHIGEAAIIKKQTRRMVADAVLDAQELQWRAGVWDLESLAEHSCRITSGSVARAHQVGLMDRQAAERIFRNNSDS